MQQEVMPKRQLLSEVRRFLKDKDRGISTKVFAQLCGLDPRHLTDVFLYQASPLTEYVQIRVSKAYKAWQRGDIAVMQNQDRSRYFAYRREPLPRTGNTTQLQMVNGEIKIRMGMRNLADYSQPTLDEQLRG